MTDDPTFSDATALTAALRAGTVSSVELLDAALDRVGRYGPALNAVVTLDADRARDRARAADAASARGESWGPLHGLPMTVKDVWETAGLRTTSGAPELADHVPDTDAEGVARLRRAGAVIFGKTNTPLYAGDVQTFNDVFGITNNPWDTTRTPGGSSGGAAAALAAGLTPLEFGSDIGGSIRTPSHLCGTFGLKPSWGVVPSRGHIPGPPGSLIETDVNAGGPMARSVRDLELALGVLAGPLPDRAAGWRLELPPAPSGLHVADLRIDVVADDETFPVSAEVRGAVRGLADQLADAGAQVQERPFPVLLGDMFRSWQDLVLPIIGAGLPAGTYEEFAGLAGLMTDDDVGSRSVRALVLSHRDHLAADQVRQQQRARWDDHFATVDVVLAPPMQVAAFPHDTRETSPIRTVDVDGRTISHLDLSVWCGAIGAMLLPVVAVPAGTTSGGLPVGVQVIGPYLSDRCTLAAADAISAVAGGFTPPPGY
jgi:amidase